jgi:putative Mg2+ transporter-C (MgtC) family protein
MSDHEWNLALQILLKLGVGAILGGLVGLERELRDHPAGIRTHTLLILGAIIYAEVSRGYSSGDPGRVTAQIVTGVGFLCAGTILRTGTDVKGLTTAASLWATSAIGVAISMGGAFMAVAIVATLLTLFTLSIVAKLEKRFFPQSQTHVLEVALDSAEVLVDVLQQVHMKPAAMVKGVVVKSKAPECRVELKVRGESSDIVAEIMAIQGVKNASIEK